jgi:tetratricopeptide (TPR) repeat protein
MKNCVYIFIALLIFGGCDETSTPEKNTESEKEIAAPLSKAEELTLEIRKSPKNAELYYQRSQAYVDDQMFLLALEDINRALKIDSVSSKFHSFKGEIHYFNAKPDKARDSFERAISLDPKNTDALLKLAEIQLLLRNYQDCFNRVNEALRINQQLYKGYFLKGYAYLELGDTSLAVSSIQTAVEINPRFYDGYMTLGDIHAMKGSNLAIEYYNSALESRPGDQEAMYNLGLYLQNSKRLEDAVIVYDRMIEVDENSVRAWYNRGYILLELQQKPAEAIPFFERAIEIAPQYIDAVYNLGLCYEDIGEIAEARKHYTKALEMNPQYDLAAYGMERLQRLK